MTGATEAGRRSGWWGAGSAILITLACVLAPLAVVSVWASEVLSDTDQYVETVAPVAEDPAVQAALADDVTAAVLERLDVEAITTEALDALAQQENVPPRVAAALPGLAVPIVNGVESFTQDQVDALVASPQFATIWAQVNRVAHEQVVTLLEGNQGGALSAQGDTITVNLGPIVAEVKNRLVDRGFTLAENIPPVDRSFVLVQNDAIASAQDFYSLLNTLGVWLPIVALALFVVGVLLARDRRRALLRGGLGLTAAMLVLGVVLALGRMWYAETTPAGILTEDAAAGVFDTMVRFLRTSLRAVAVLGLVLAFAAFIVGPTRAAVKTRATLEGSIGSARGAAQQRGWDTGSFGTWIYAHRRALRIGVLVAGGLVLAFASQPTGWFVLGTALVVVIVLGLVELLARPPVSAEAAAAEPGAAPTLPRQMPRTPTEEAPSTPPGEQARQPAEKGPDPGP